MVQADAALREAVAVMRRTGWLDTDRCPSADAIEQLLRITDRRHAQGGQEPAVEGPRLRELTHGQHNMRHAVDPDRGVSCRHGHPSVVADRDQSSSASRRTAGASGFLNLSQSGDRPNKVSKGKSNWSRP